MAGIKDIARELGVSHMTVSAVLNGGSGTTRVGKATAERIRAKAVEMGYQANFLARSLRSGKTFSMGFLFPIPVDNIYGELIGGVNNALEGSPYSGVFSFWSTKEGQGAATELMLSRKPDGIVTVEPRRLPESVRLPVLSLFNADERFDAVLLDRQALFDRAVGYLKKLGHRRIAWIKYQHSPEREAMFVSSLKKHGLDADAQSRAPCLEAGLVSETLPLCAEVARWLLAERKRPTALLMSNDAAALAMLAALPRFGLAVPRDLSMVGLDNMSMSAVSTPALTTFSHGGGAGFLSRLLVEKLRERMDSPDMPRRVFNLIPELVERASCCPPGKDCGR